MEQMSDPRILRALAHRTRARVLDELEATGPMRATDVAQALGIPANQASFHLRQLAKYGLIEEAPEAARDGRDRVWKTVNDTGLRVNLAEIAKEPGGKAAVSVFRRQWLAQAHGSLERSMQWEERSDSTVNVASGTVRLTKAEAETLADELAELFDRHRRAGTKGPKTATTYEFLTLLQPAEEI